MPGWVDVKRILIRSLEMLVIDVRKPEPDLAELTEGEREVVRLVLEGKSNREIAEERGVSPRTVANQLRAVFKKLGVFSRFELAAEIERRRTGIWDLTRSREG